MFVDLCTKFQISRIILTSFRQGGGGGGGWILPKTPKKQTPKRPTQIKVTNVNIVTYITFVYVNSS